MLKQVIENSDCFNLCVDTSTVQLRSAENTRCQAAYNHYLYANTHCLAAHNHEKMEVLPSRYYEPLCTKGFRILKKAVCENSSEIPVKHRNSAQFRLRMTIFWQIFTMSKNGRLKFQRFSRRLEKVRDCSTKAALGQHRAGRRQTTAAPLNNHCSATEQPLQRRCSSFGAR